MKIGTNDINKIMLGSAEVEKIYLGTEQVYSGGSKPTPVPYDEQYLTFEAISAGTFTLTINSGVTTGDVVSVSYSLDNGNTWTTTNNVQGQEVVITTPTVNAGDKVLWKGIANRMANNTNAQKTSTFSSTCEYNVEGNIMSLLYGDDFEDKVSLSGKNYCFTNLFIGNHTTLISAENLILPQTLEGYCYYAMFRECRSLTAAPTLAVNTTGGAYSCAYMFYNCISMTTAPELPATTLTSNCYNSMFYGCTSLTTAPELPATTLTQACYNAMFRGCSSLNYIKCLATDISASNCTTSWVRNISSSGTFVKAASMSSWTTGGSGIPDGWTVQDEEHYLTFVAEADNMSVGLTNAGNNVYQYSTDSGITWNNLANSGSTSAVNSGQTIMFKASGLTVNGSDGIGTLKPTVSASVQGNVMSLVYDDNFSGQTTITNQNQFRALFYQCTNITSAENLKLPATTLTSRCYASMFYGCTNLTSAPELPATTLAQSCYEFMFRGCTSLTTAPQLPATTLANECYAYMFEICINLTTAPELPATVLANLCYYDMFNGCTSLEEAPELPATTLSLACYYGMFNGCVSLIYIKCLATDISATDCTTNWVNDVFPNGTFVKASSMSDWTRGVNGIPDLWDEWDDADFDLSL